MPGLRIRRKPPPATTTGFTAGDRARCNIPTLLKRATGTSGRYTISAVRALPLRFRGGQRSTNKPAFRHNVVLQATDGHQAVCVLTDGAIERPTLIPAEVLPSRQADRGDGPVLDGKRWRAKNGDESNAIDPNADFPPIGPVLPETYPGTIAVAISVDRLRRVAAGLGTDTITLLVPPAKKTPGKPKTPATVRDPIGVCPAGKDDTEGVAVMLPVECQRSQAYYNRVREAVIEAEQPGKRKKTRRSSKTMKEVAA